MHRTKEDTPVDQTLSRLVASAGVYIDGPSAWSTCFVSGPYVDQVVVDAPHGHP